MLTRLPTSEGVLSLFRHLRGFAAVQDLSDATPGGFGALMLEVAASFSDVGLYRLTPGRLPAMIDVVESVLGGRT